MGKPFGLNPGAHTRRFAKLPASPRQKRWSKPCFQKLTISIGGVLRFCPGLVAVKYLYWGMGGQPGPELIARYLKLPSKNPLSKA